MNNILSHYLYCVSRTSSSPSSPTKKPRPSRKQKSHRTVIVMCDNYPASILDEARREILAPLNYTTNIETESAWIPSLSIIPQSDMHVTVACLWWYVEI